MVTYRNKAGQPSTCFEDFDKSAKATADLIRKGTIPNKEFPFDSISELADYLRGLPQTDDEGDTCSASSCNHGCIPAQRQRFMPADPNCWERSYAFAVLAHLLQFDIIITDDFVRIGGTIRRHCWVTLTDGTSVEMYGKDSKRQRRSS